MQKSSDTRYSSQTIENMDMDFISIECLEKLDLSQNPFIDHARDPFLFVDKQMEMSINVLIDYLLNQNSSIVLLGEVGIGKTTHLRMLLRKGYKQFNFCTLRAKPKITFTEIEEKIKERWCLPGSDDENVSLPDIDSDEYLTTDEHIREYIEDNKQPVLIIDDAHRLQDNVLDELLKLKHHVGLQSPKAMGLVLASEPDLKTQLAELEQINPAATQIYQINVRSFDAAQCEEYIQYRMSKAGAITDPSFSPEKIMEIYSRSKGLPKLINKLARAEIARMCEQNRIATGTTNKLKSDPGMRLGLILAGLVALVVFLAALSRCSTEVNETVALAIDKSGIEQNNTDLEHNPNPESEPENTTIAKPYVAPLVLGPLQEDKKDTTDSAQQTKKVTKVDPSKTTAQNKFSDTAKAATKALSYSSDWILEQDPNAYTIQVVASPKENNLIDFVKKNALTDDTAYYQKSSADKTWFILVHGVYASHDEALKSIEQLPDKLKRNTPYPVRIKSLQEIIRQQ